MSLARVEDPSRKVLLSSLGAALFIVSLGALDFVTRGAVDLPALIPPFGASTVIVFFAPDTAASRPFSVIVGHLGSAASALLALSLLPGAPPYLQGALAVSGSALWMVATKSVHPPGGATALLTVLGAGRVGASAAVLLPLLAGCLTLVGVRFVLDLGIGLLRPSAPATREAREDVVRASS